MMIIAGWNAEYEMQWADGTGRWLQDADRTREKQVFQAQRSRWTTRVIAVGQSGVPRMKEYIFLT